MLVMNLVEAIDTVRARDLDKVNSRRRLILRQVRQITLISKQHLDYHLFQPLRLRNVKEVYVKIVGITAARKKDKSVRIYSSSKTFRSTSSRRRKRHSYSRQNPNADAA